MSDEVRENQEHSQRDPTSDVDWFCFRHGCDPCLAVLYKGRFLILPLPSDIDKTVAELVESIDRETP